MVSHSSSNSQIPRTRIAPAYEADGEVESPISDSRPPLLLVRASEITCRSRSSAIWRASPPT